MKPSALARRRANHICVFGDPKTGKSTLVAELLMHQTNLKIVWLSMDNGHEVIFKLPVPPEVLDQRLEILVLPDTKENPCAIRTVRAILSGASVNICDTHGEVNCSTCRAKQGSFTNLHAGTWGPETVLVLDHIGQLANSAMTVAYKKYKKDPEEKPEWDQYGMQGILMDGILTNIQQAPYHAVCITHVCESEMEDGTKKLVPMGGTTNFSRNMGKYFDHIVYCHMLNGKHRFGSATGYQAKVVTGSRLDVTIEGQSSASLMPFFDGTIKGKEVEDRKVAAKILTGLGNEAAAKLSIESVPEVVAPEVSIVTSEESPVVEIVSAPAVKAKPESVDRAALLAKLRTRNGV